MNMLQPFFILLFWGSIFLIFFSYFIYPAILIGLKWIIRFRPQKQDHFPPISIIISAFNEEKHIGEKIENTLSLDYPTDKFEILIGSDGSLDRTADIVQSYKDSRIRFFNYPENRGKTAVQNDLVQESRNPILIFTDAASFLTPDTLQKLTQHFADERIGCVAGKMIFTDTQQNLNTASQGLYWNYETALRNLESSLGSMIGVDGPLYAVRKETFTAVPPHVISDLMVPLLVSQHGRRVVLEPEALVFEAPTFNAQQEFKTRRRVTLRGLIGIFSYPSLLNPIKHPLLSFQIISHKLLRWMVGLLGIVNFLSCISLANISFFFYIFLIYLLFLSLAAIGAVAAKYQINAKVTRIPYYFCLVNTAALFGTIDFLLGKKASTWNTVRKSSTENTAKSVPDI